MQMFNKRKNLSEESNNTLEEQPLEEKENALIEIVRFSIIALIIVIPIRMFIAQPFIVSGESMVETFQNGEYLIVDQVSYRFNEPKRGDVVIFRYPIDPSKFFIKRIIGLPGDEIIIKDDTITIYNEKNPDGMVLDEPYITPMTNSPDEKKELGEREYFVMGDNRNHSSDSRAWGVLMEDRIIGRAILRLYPLQTLDYLPGASEYTNVTSSSS
ncbi:signal peptidase I [Candidatus Kaiserbacteria bacterium]|nr:signal peptidase I [Candidatus Kaiserbacteria bacterium]